MQNFKSLQFGGIFALGVMSGVLGWRWHVNSRPERMCSDVPCAHYHDRLAAIDSQAGQLASGRRYLALGDSIFERAEMPALCGRTAFNAGMGYATVATMIPIARGIADRVKPDFVVIGLGTNDALLGRLATFRVQATRLVASLHGYKVLWVSVPPGPRVQDAGAFNAVIATLRTPIARALPAVDTVDGVHLTPRAYGPWKASIADGAARGLCDRL